MLLLGPIAITNINIANNINGNLNVFNGNLNALNGNLNAVNGNLGTMKKQQVVNISIFFYYKNS